MGTAGARPPGRPPGELRGSQQEGALGGLDLPTYVPERGVSGRSPAEGSPAGSTSRPPCPPLGTGCLSTGLSDAVSRPRNTPASLRRSLEDVPPQRGGLRLTSFVLEMIEGGSPFSFLCCCLERLSSCFAQLRGVNTGVLLAGLGTHSGESICWPKTYGDGRMEADLVEGCWVCMSRHGSRKDAWAGAQGGRVQSRGSGHLSAPSGQPVSGPSREAGALKARVETGEPLVAIGPQSCLRKGDEEPADQLDLKVTRFLSGVWLRHLQTPPS